MSLANKYRPKNFDTLIGQEHITGILKAKIKSDKGGHSNFLLFGPRGTGKTSSARILAKAMNCLNLQDGNPCDTCANCQTINEGKTLDYVEIDAASHTGVDNIREEILDKVAYPPTMLKKKIYVIDEVHMLSKGAFNALLKTIEEPKDTMAFILATTEIHKVPDTIISRCQVFNFRKVPDQEMVARLEEICKSEGLAYEPAALSIIAKISEGCVRDAVKYIDQVSILGEVNEEHVTKFLGVASESGIQQFLAHIKNKDRDQLFAAISDLVQQGVDLQNFAKQVLMYLDAHLFEDMDFLISISQAFTEILNNLRYYPYPAIAYKVVLYKYTGDIPVAAAPTMAAPVVTPTVSTPTPSIPTPVASPSIAPAPVASAPAASVPSTPVDTNNLTALWDSVLGKIDKESLQKSLKDHSVISKIESGFVYVTVINKFTQAALEKQENKQYIEGILSQILGKPTALAVQFQNKDDFFSGNLGF